MKKTIVIIFALLLTLPLAACSLQLPWSQAEAGAAEGASGMPGLDASNITPDARLAIGTLKLEGTDLAVSPETASALLPLWKAVRALGSSSNVSPQEMDALFAQIRESMSVEQVKAIEEMDLANLDLRSLMADLGIQPGGLNAQATPGAGQGFGAMQGGNFPGGEPARGGGGGGFPGGGGGPPGGFAMRFEGGAPPDGMMGGPVAEGTPMPGVSTYEGTSRITRMVLQALITMLEERAAS